MRVLVLFDEVTLHTQQRQLSCIIFSFESNTAGKNNAG